MDRRSVWISWLQLATCTLPAAILNTFSTHTAWREEPRAPVPSRRGTGNHLFDMVKRNSMPTSMEKWRTPGCKLCEFHTQQLRNELSLSIRHAMGSRHRHLWLVCIRVLSPDSSLFHIDTRQSCWLQQWTAHKRKWSKVWWCCGWPWNIYIARHTANIDILFHQFLNHPSLKLLVVPRNSNGLKAL